MSCSNNFELLIIEATKFVLFLFIITTVRFSPHAIVNFNINSPKKKNFESVKLGLDNPTPYGLLAFESGLTPVLYCTGAVAILTRFRILDTLLDV